MKFDYFSFFSIRRGNHLGLPLEENIINQKENEMKKHPENKSNTSPFASAKVAKNLERTQINKYHTKGGTGFAAEDANIFHDRVRLKKVEVTGNDNSLNGADRIVDGVAIQTKYYSSARETVNSAFNAKGGSYRYGGQVLEVPADQYEDAIKIMREKILGGRVPGVSNPDKAGELVKKGSVTYRQARNIAKAGNINSICFDAKTQAVTTSYVFAISFAVHYAKLKWDGKKSGDAVKEALKYSLSVGGSTLMTGMVSAQVMRTRAAALGTVAARKGVKAVQNLPGAKKAIEKIAQASLGKAVYGAAAVNHVSKLLRGNVITGTIATAATSTPDFCRAAFCKSISWGQFGKNLTVNAAGVAAGTGGWVAGSAGGATVGGTIGSVVPVLGTAIGATVGGAVGGILGAIGIGCAGAEISKAVLDEFIEDDAVRMYDILRGELESLAVEYLLSEKEIEVFAETVKERVNHSWLRSMYQAGGEYDLDYDRRDFARAEFEPVCERLAAARPKVKVPKPDKVFTAVNRLVDSLPQDDGAQATSHGGRVINRK